MEQFVQFLNGTSEEQNIVLLSFILTAFLLGLFLAWAVQNAGIRRLESDLKKKEDAAQLATAEKLQLEEVIALKTADLKRAIFEREEAHATQKLLEQDNQSLQEELTQMRLQFDKLQSANSQYLSTIEDLNDQILGLKLRSTQTDATQRNVSAAPASESTNTELRIAALEARLRQLEQQTLPVSDISSTQPRDIFQDAVNEDTEEPELFLRPFQRVEPSPQPRAMLQDDLTAIDGIGPFLERKLNEIGVFTFAQISSWNAAQIEEVTHQIQFFPGRIEKDDWVGQAKRLLEQPPVHPMLAEEEAHEDDLKLIEGIGPAIEAILKKAGIRTFEAIAKTDPEEMETILQIANPKLTLFDADTWPAQASMAMHQDWDGLQNFQDTLRAGRPTLDEDAG